MSFRYLAGKYTQDPDLPERSFKLLMRKKLLEGSFYDIQKYDFDTEVVGNDTYIPIKDRAPNITTGTCLFQQVVQESIAMLADASHFPTITTNDPKSDKVFMDLVKESRLVSVISDAARRGAIGSVAIQMQVITNRNGLNRVYFTPYDSIYLTPAYDPNEPDRLIAITQKYKIKGKDLVPLGYTIAPDDMKTTYWFQQVCDEDSETWYVPWKVCDEQDAQSAGKPFVPVVDETRTVVHNLGFCPWVWIKNLDSDDDIDGRCTFEAGIDNCILIDQLDSQAGRGLKYSMDPLLLLKEPPAATTVDSAGASIEGAQIEDQNALIRSADRALKMDVDGDAKYLEISGTACEAVSNFLDKLIGQTMQAMQGSRVNPDQINSHQGAKALEILHAPMIRLAGNLRNRYGEEGLVGLLGMFAKAAAERPIYVQGELVDGLCDPSAIALRWPAWFAPTETDLTTQATGLAILVANGLMSRQTATEKLAPGYDIEKVQAELARIASEKAADAEALAQATPPVLPTPAQAPQPAGAPKAQ